jgi:Dyp-type peroxidase family
METVEWSDVQGLVTSGYPKLPFAAYILWHFLSDGLVDDKRWIAGLAERLMRVGDGDEESKAAVDTPQSAPTTTLHALKGATGSRLRAINLAFTESGIKKLDSHAHSSFSLEFIEGMAPLANSEAGERRSNVLGDLNASSPDHWDWGGWSKNRKIDGVLLLFAADESSLQELVDAEIKAMAGVAEPLCHEARPFILRGRVFDDKKEHFGFRDGVSQPLIEGSRKHAEQDTAQDVNKKRILSVKPGEFILGYRNERRATVAPQSKSDRTRPGAVHDVRRNGSYLVFRQLEQDVPAFNAFVAGVAQSRYGNAGPATTDAVAARLVGREQDGTPLVPPAADSHGRPELRNDFLYYFEDPFGLACPVGSHIRRANPRDTAGPDPDTALHLSKMHRIIRRGRPYGKQFQHGNPDNEATERGMLFIALNADIAGQFEMIQHSWLNNRHFGGLCGGTDPFGHFSDAGDVLTIQYRPTNLHVDRPAPFVRVRGGAYFFLPGINAVRALATRKNSPQ